MTLRTGGSSLNHHCGGDGDGQRRHVPPFRPQYNYNRHDTKWRLLSTVTSNRFLSPSSSSRKDFVQNENKNEAEDAAATLANDRPPQFFGDLNLHPATAQAVAAITTTTTTGHANHNHPNNHNNTNNNKNFYHQQPPPIRLTDIQAQSFGPARRGYDILGHARTGTGKTLAFLLPSLERLLEQAAQGDHNHNDDDNQKTDKIQMLILSPTRELAQQTATTVRQLLEYHHQHQHDDDNNKAKHWLTSQAMYGGIPKFRDMQQLQQRIPTILTATPGRLVDHVQSTTLPVASSISLAPSDDNPDHANASDRQVPFSQYLLDVQIVVFDEMDVLLDMGFREPIREILRHMTRPDRQTLFFSATTTKAVQQMIPECVASSRSPNDVVVIDCIPKNDDNSCSNESYQKNNKLSGSPINIPQSYVVLPTDKLIWRVVQILVTLMEKPHHKLLVFFPTTAQVAFFARLFQQGLGRPVLEMHAQLSQGRRSVASDRFRQARYKAVLFTTDVSARGVDYPHVTHVVQVGVAPNKETYIHRLGRTGRAGRHGEGLVLLAPAELPALQHEYKDLPLQAHAHFQNLMQKPLPRREENDRLQYSSRMRQGQFTELESDIAQVYEAVLSYYSSCIRRWSKNEYWQDDVVQLATEYCRQAGLSEMPRIKSRLASKLGLAGHPGLFVRDRWAAGHTFDVGIRGMPDDGNEFQPHVARRSNVHRQRIANTRGIWEDEFDT